jgi:tetratricopeptide (TPR) repeat protein
MTQRLKDTLINVGVGLTGVALAVGIFFVLQDYTRKKEIDNLVPKAAEALNNKEYSLAINLLSRAENELPKNDARLSNVKVSLANLYYTKGRYDDALKYYNQLTPKELTKSEYENIGDIYFKRNNLDKVVEYWTKGEIRPTNRYKLSKIYYEREDFDNYFTELEKINTYREPLLLEQVKETDLANVLISIDKAKTLESISDDNLDIDLFRTQIDNAKKQSDNNKREFSELIQISAYSDLNQCRLLMERIVNLRKTLESKKIPTSQLDFYEGKCLNQVNKPDQAITLLDRSIKFDATIVPYREALARSYFLKSDSEKIKSIYKDIITIEKSAKHYENLGFYMYKLNLLDEANTAYNDALSNAAQDADKARISEVILEINIRDKKDLEICKRDELLTNIQSESTQERILTSGYCAVYLNKEYAIDAQKYPLINQYFDAIRKKDKGALDKVLDKDLDGLVTTYYEAVGVGLIKN